MCIKAVKAHIVEGSVVVCIEGSKFDTKVLANRLAAQFADS